MDYVLQKIYTGGVTELVFISSKTPIIMAFSISAVVLDTQWYTFIYSVTPRLFISSEALPLQVSKG